LINNNQAKTCRQRSKLFSGQLRLRSLPPNCNNIFRYYTVQYAENIREKYAKGTSNIPHTENTVYAAAHRTSKVLLH